MHTPPEGHGEPYISEFIQTIMPEGTSSADLLDAQRDLDGFLDIIDQVEERLFTEGYYEWTARRKCIVPWQMHSVKPHLDAANCDIKMVMPPSFYS